jgi:Cof subfamily protein (haloacid dehalogenase superfamily)
MRIEMKYKNILIVSDIDGTFTDSKSRLVQRNLDAVEYFKENGGLFAIATGRVPESMGKLAPIINTLVNSPCICCNGAFAYDFTKNERIGEIELDYEKTTELIKLVRKEFPTVGIRISSRVGYCIPHLNDYIHRELDDHVDELSSKGLYHVNEIDFLPHDGWTRTAFCESSETLNSLRERFEDEYSEYFAFSKASPEIYEFQDKSATKGTALDRLREFLIKSGRADKSLKIYALGDFENDLDMLRHCDVPACPANAIPEVKKLAQIHLCHCDEGAVANLIELI